MRYCWILLCLWLITPTALHAEDGVIINGSGATFPFPLYQHWIEAYRDETGSRVDYQAIGSGEGIKALMAQSVDFGGTDAFLSDEELRKAPAPVVHIPTCLGAVVITYNLPGKPQLRFTPKLLADIFLGHIKNWQDPAIAAVNPGLQLPDLPMTVVHRSEGSGTSFVLTNYLSAVSTEWRERIGAGKLVRWQAGIGVEGNPKVAAFIKKIPGAVGYVESTYAWREKLPQAALQNKSGQFVSATSEAISQAANIELPDDCRGLIVNTSAEQGYPISAFSYLIVYADQNYAQRSELKGQALVRYLWWAIHQGQAGNAKLWYAPLPAPVVKKAEEIVQAINFAGRPLDPTLNKAIHP